MAKIVVKGFFSESAMGLSNLQKSIPNHYRDWNLNFPSKTVNNLFNFLLRLVIWNTFLEIW